MRLAIWRWLSDSLNPLRTRSAGSWKPPFAWRVIDEDVRRCLIRPFPYGVLYTIEPEQILIVAVMHLSREPGYWLRRLDES
jgi:hypothetical protein